MNDYYKNLSFLKRYAWLSIGAAITTIILKAIAYLLTNSVGLLSDALESGVNLLGAVMALAMLSVAARPADEDHTYGHSKAEYFSSGVEGTLIIIAAISIVATAIPRLITPKPLEQINIGLQVSVAASAINLTVALILMKVGKRHNSISIQADAQHLMTDVWTSAGVLVGVGLVAITGWQRLDPIVAFLVAANIIWTGARIIRLSALGLMDTALSAEELTKVQKILQNYARDGIEYHALRTRQSGSRQFVSFHVLVPGKWTVQRGHRLLENMEADIRKVMPSVIVFTHLESLNDPASWDDTNLDRTETPPTK